MRSQTIPLPENPVDPAAAWLRLIARERRSFQSFCRASGDDDRLTAYQAWTDAHQQLMDQPAPNEAALIHKIRTLLLMSDMQAGHKPTDLSAVCSDLWRMGDMDRRPANAEDWIELFECLGGRWSVDAGGVAFFIQLPGTTDADLMLVRRLEAQLHDEPELEQAVHALILEGEKR